MPSNRDATEQRAEAGLLTHLSEEPIVDEVDHKDLQDEKRDDYCPRRVGTLSAFLLLGIQTGSWGGGWSGPFVVS